MPDLTKMTIEELVAAYVEWLHPSDHEDNGITREQLIAELTRRMEINLDSADQRGTQ